MTKQLALALTISSVLGISACTSMDKLQARLEADPQCPPVMNAKTGSLMPCPTPPKPQPAVTTQKNVQPSSAVTQAPASGMSATAPLNTPQNTVNNPPQVSVSNSGSPAKATAPSSPSITANPECKGVLHQKTGALMPCPNP